MRLVKLWIQGFRSFVQRQEISFGGPGTVTAVTGWNAATHSGSGTGKSTIFEALATLFGYASFAATTQQTYLANVPMDIEGLFEHEGRKINIRRGKQTYVTIDAEQKASGTTAVNAWIKDFFKLQDLEILSTLTYRPQRSTGLFLSLTDGKKREFISEVLGLQKYENMADAAGKEANALQQKAAGLEAALKELPAVEVPEAPLLPELPPAPNFNIDLTPTYSLCLGYDGGDLQAVVKVGIDSIGKTFDGRLGDCKLRAGDMNEVIAGVDAKLKILKDEVEQRRAESRKRIAAAKSEAQLRCSSEALTEVVRIQGQLNVANEGLGRIVAKAKEAAKQAAANVAAEQACNREFVRLQTQLAGMKSAIEASTTKLEALKQQKCNECGQPLPDTTLLEVEQKRYEKLLDDAGVLIDQLDAEAARGRTLEAQVQVDKAEREQAEQAIKAAGDVITRLQLELQNRETLTRNDVRTATAIIEAEEVKKLDAELAELQNVADQLQLMRNEAGTKLRAIDEERATVSDQKRAAVERLMAWSRDVERRQADHKSLCERMQATHQMAVKHAVETNQRRSNLLLEIAAIRSEALTLSDLQATAKAFLGAIGEEVLAETSDETNTALAELPNTRGYTLSFVGEHLTQTGKLKQEIRAVVRNAFVEGVDLKSQLSGGQLASAELAVDLAWAVVLRRRRGSTPTPAWLILDEAFDGHDAPIKEAAAEILHRIASQAGMQVLVVDHASEFGARAENAISVVFTENGTLVQ